MSLIINENYGTVTHIEGSNVTINNNTRTTELSKEPTVFKDIEDVHFEDAQQFCYYLNIEQIKDSDIWKPSDIEDKLRQACEADAKTLATFLKKYTDLGYLDFHGDSKKKILVTLQEHFPTMRKYSYQNFANYF